jgi:hypothetical protein
MRGRPRTLDIRRMPLRPAPPPRDGVDDPGKARPAPRKVDIPKRPEGNVRQW